MAGLDCTDRFACPCASCSRSRRDVGLHVADSRGDVLWLQIAHVLARAKTARRCPLWSRSRLLVPVAGNGCGTISTLARERVSRAEVDLACFPCNIRKYAG